MYVKEKMRKLRRNQDETINYERSSQNVRSKRKDPLSMEMARKRLSFFKNRPMLES